jgi:hypothetical protein
VTRRQHAAIWRIPHGEVAAIGEVQAVPAAGRTCSSQLADTHLGVSVTQPVDQLAARMLAQASLAARAGADMDAIGRWIAVGVERGESIQASRLHTR